MKAKFVREGKEIFFRDRNGAKWSEECIAELFETVHMFNLFLDNIQYYKSKRVDGKDFYENNTDYRLIKRNRNG